MTTAPIAAIRAVTRGDQDGLEAMLAATGMFPDHELAEVLSMLAGHLDGSLEGEHRWAVAVGDTQPVGVAYWAPERMTDGTWNLYMLAVHPEHQGQNIGAALVRHVEGACAGEGVRLLLVETLDTPDFEPQRRFYRRCGYDAEACIRDFYGAGFGKVIFRKTL